MGKPGLRVICNWIHRLQKQTRGTETSKYPQEKKSIEIALVAASERVTADGLCCSGIFWEVERYRVIAPYTKQHKAHIK